MHSVGPLLPEVYSFGWVLALGALLVIVALAGALLYLIVRKAVAAGLRDAGEQGSPPLDDQRPS